MINIQITRNATKTYTYTQEYLEGVLYLVTRMFLDLSEPAVLIQYTRADTVKG